MTPAGWLLIALSVLLIAPTGATGPARRAGGRRRNRVPGRGRSPTASVCVVVVSVAALCLVVGGIPAGGSAAVVLCPSAALAVRRLGERPVRLPADAALPLCLDLVAAALRAGRPLPVALLRAAPAARADTAADLTRVGQLLRLGAEPASTWNSLGRAGPLAEVAATARRSGDSGIKLAGAFERVAVSMRVDRTATAAVRAQRAGVHAMAPLAACFLPSFVCLGVIPVVVGVAGSLLHNVA
jgi:Flp pilus assembly protein TadB